MKSDEPRASRREWLRYTAGTALALGLWPGCAMNRDNGRGGEFTFVALNDTHYSSPQCPQFFERVTESIKSRSSKLEFCLVIGDLSEHGTESELGAMRDVLRGLKVPVHAVIGNHDYASQTDRSPWDRLFKGSLNYHFEHRGWNVVGLDSSEGVKYQETSIQSATLRWMDDNLRKLDKKLPTVLFTHFPLGPGARYRPKNADALLERFEDFNIVSVLNGHFHSFTEKTVGETVFTTNKCCSIARNNHDGTKEKGYFLCRAKEGRIVREFIEVRMA